MEYKDIEAQRNGFMKKKEWVRRQAGDCHHAKSVFQRMGIAGEYRRKREEKKSGKTSKHEHY